MSVVSYRVVNVEEKIGKTVGRREPCDPWTRGMRLQETAGQLRTSAGHGGICPRGVYRFKTHEEADAWMMNMLVTRANRRRS